VTVRLLLVLVAAAAALVLTGCSEETSGAATPGGDGGSTARPTIPGGNTDEPPEPSEDPGDSGIADLQPCDLLTDADKTQLEVDAGTEEEVGVERTCLFTASGSHTVTIGIADNLGLEDVQSSTPTKSMKIGSHDAVQSTGGASSCAVNLGVTDTSRVDVISAANGDVTKACSIAKQAAELVEPKLP
jgi:hypothetical protein